LSDRKGSQEMRQKTETARQSSANRGYFLPGDSRNSAEEELLRSRTRGSMARPAFTQY